MTTPHPALPSARSPQTRVFARFTKTRSLFRTIGYVLLGFSFVDLLDILIPINFTNPVWTYQIIGDLVHLIPVPLLAFMLIFFGRASRCRYLERQVLRILSWLTLLVGFLFLSLIPVAIHKTIQIGHYNNGKIDIQAHQQKQQLNAIRQQVERATPEQLQNLVSKPSSPSSNTLTFAQTKARILTNLEQAKQQADVRAAHARRDLRHSLLKQTTKLTIESLFGGFAFLYLGLTNRWARRLPPSTKPATFLRWPCLRRENLKFKE